MQILLFDENFNPIVLPSSAGEQVTDIHKGSYAPLSAELVVTSSMIPEGEIGYAYVYLANSNKNGGANMFFDDFTIAHCGLDLVQSSDYYPFGLAMLDNWQKDGEEYRFGYQGEFAEKDGETGWNHFEARKYDPVIARWMIGDPERQFNTPYSAMGNNPISNIDSDGKYVIRWASIGRNSNLQKTVLRIDVYRQSYAQTIEFAGALPVGGAFASLLKGIHAYQDPAVEFNSSDWVGVGLSIFGMGMSKYVRSIDGIERSALVTFDAALYTPEVVLYTAELIQSMDEVQRNLLVEELALMQMASDGLGKLDPTGLIVTDEFLSTLKDEVRAEGVRGRQNIKEAASLKLDEVFNTYKTEAENSLPTLDPD